MVKIEDTTEEVKRAITGKDYGILVEVSTREGLRSMQYSIPQALPRNFIFLFCHLILDFRQCKMEFYRKSQIYQIC